MNNTTRLFRFLIAFIVLSFFCQYSIFAVPAYPYPIEVKQPNGQSIKIQIKGDESFSYQTTEDGYVIVKNNKGYYVYSQQQADHDKFVPTDIVVHRRNSRTRKETNFLMTAPKGLTDKQKAYQEMSVAAARIRTAAANAYKSSSTSAAKIKAATADGEIMLAPKTGSPHFLVFLFSYNDVKFTFSQNDFSRMLNESGYNTNGAFGSATDFFKANSWGQFQPVFDVVGPIQLSGNRVDYGGPNGDAGNMFAQGAVIADQKFGVNFATYDYDNNGVVDNIYGFFAGYDEAQGGGSDCVWSHASGIWGKNVVLDGKRINGYGCSSELKGNTGANKVNIGTFVHEFGHVLGLPDFYQTDGSTNGECVDLKSWSTMAGGCYNNDSRCPPLYGAMEREMLGWYTIPELKTTTSNVTLNKIQDKAAYKVKTTTPNEFYVLEYREKTGFDSSLPASGMLIFHVDKSDRTLTAVVGGNSTTTTYANLWNNNMVNCIAGHACYDLIEANNNNDASLSTAAMWPGSTGNKSFTDASSPSMKSWSGLATNKPIINIADHGTSATFDFMQGVVSEPSIATCYSDCSYGGSAVGLPEGSYTTSKLASYGINNDVISSIKVLPGYTVTIYTDDNFSGNSKVYTSDISCLVEDGFNDLISSLKIEAKGVPGLSGIYKIQGRNSGFCLDVFDYQTANGSKVVQWNSGSGVNQQFALTEIGNGIYKIIGMHSGKSIDIKDVSIDNSAQLQIWDYYPDAKNQQFILVSVGSGYYQLVARHSGKVIEVPGDSRTAGETLQQYDNNSQTCSHWKLQSVAPDYVVINKEDVSSISSYLDLRYNDINLWNGLDGVTSTKGFEGSSSISWTVNSSAIGGSFGFGIHNNNYTYDFSGIADYNLHFAIKTNVTDVLGVKLTGINSTEKTVNLNGNYAIKTNSTWQEVNIPMSAFTSQGLKLGSLNANVMFSIVCEKVTGSGKTLEIDDVYYKKPTVPTNAIVSSISVTKTVGESVTFNVSASGQSLVYQWQKDGNNINGANNSSYVINAVGVDNAGTYTCVVSNSGGNITSNGSVLTVNVPTFSTDITDNGGTITTSNAGVSIPEGIDKSIDNVATSKYCAKVAASTPVWIQYQSPKSVILKSYSMTSANDAQERDPKTWKLQGSDNGTDWIDVDAQTNQTFVNRYEKKTFTVSTTKSYKYFRLYVTDKYVSTSTHFQLSEWQLFGTEVTTTGMNTLSATVNIYPNPAKEEVFIQVEEKSNVYVYDM